MSELKDIILNTFSEFEDTLNGQKDQKIHEVRKEAIRSFEKLGLPGRKHEEYKYTQLTRQLQKQFDLTSINVESKADEADIKQFRFPHEDANIIYFVNGVYQKQLSNLVSPKEELEILDLNDAYATHAEEINKHFGKYVKFGEDAFAAINTAFSQHGAFIKVAKNKVIEKPIILHFITDSRAITPIYYPRNLILIGENSQANIIETFQSLGSDKALINHVTELVAERSSIVNYFKFQEENNNTYHIDNSQAVQYEHSVFSAYTFSFSGAVVRNNLSISLEDERCETHMYGLYLLNGKTHVDNHTAVDHKKPNSESNEIYKGILDDQSTGVFNGKIFVRPDAQNTNAFQSNKNIVLTNDATINTKPQLEIWANEVKCSHGCTTGQLDYEQLFYLRSRGYSEEEGKAVLLQAFAKDVIESIKIEFLKEHLEQIITSRLVY